MPMPAVYTKTDISCPFCENYTVVEYQDIDNFQYGPGEDAPILQAPIFVYYCYDCDDSWTDWRAEDARQSAVEEHLKTKGIYLCVICHEIPVDVHDGYDTCERCINV